MDRVEELLAGGERPAAAVWASDYVTSFVAFELATAASPSGRRSPLRRRMHRHGSVAGLAVHAAAGLLPPVLSRPAAHTVARLKLLKSH